MRIDVPVVVVGAGLAGLATAYELQTLGIGCAVLESSDRSGGRIRTVHFADGQTAEAGMEEFWQGGPAYSLLQRLDLPVVEDRAQSSVVLDGRLFQSRGEGDLDAYLGGMFTVAERSDFVAWDLLTGGLLGQLTGSTGSADIAAPLSRISMREFVSATVPSRRVREWIRLVVESEIAVEWERICALDGLAEFRPFHDTPSGYGERNAHVVGGNERVVQALIRRLPAECVQLNSPVTAIRDVGTHVEVQHLDESGRPAVTTCLQVVLTVPAWALGDVKLDLPALDSTQRHSLATSLTTAAAGSYVKVLLRLAPEASELWSDRGPGLFTLLSDAPAGCLYLRSPVRDRSRPGPGAHILTMLVHGPHARRLSGLPVDDILRRRDQASGGFELGRWRRRPAGPAVEGDL